MQRFAGDPLKLFDALEKKKGQPAKLWPAQTMLLIMCPDVMVSIVSEKDSEHLRFFQRLRKTVSQAKAPDHAATCLVEFCRATTFVSGRDSALRYMAYGLSTPCR